VDKVTPPFDLIMAQGKLPKNEFSFYLQSAGKSGSMLTLGGADDKYYSGDFSYVPISMAQKMAPYWLISGKAVQVNQADAFKCSFLGCYYVVDTGTSIIVGPPDAAKQLIDKIGTVNQDCSGVEKLPTITFSFNGKTFDLGPEFYVLKQEDDKTKKMQCQIGIQGMNVGMPMWILGDPFLRKYYTVYDRANNQVGFALAKQQQETLVV